MTISGRAQKLMWLSHAGLAIMAAAFVWWFLFYAQWTGPLRLLDLKVACLVTTSDECSFFRSRLHEFHAAGPAYHPAAWWIGMAAFLAGRVSGMLLPDDAGVPLATSGKARAAASTRRATENDGAPQ
jgi:hypothetical protein